MRDGLRVSRIGLSTSTFLPVSVLDTCQLIQRASHTADEPLPLFCRPIRRHVSCAPNDRLHIDRNVRNSERLEQQITTPPHVIADAKMQANELPRPKAVQRCVALTPSRSTKRLNLSEFSDPTISRTVASLISSTTFCTTSKPYVLSVMDRPSYL